MHTKKESMPFSHEFLILLFLKNPDILFLLVRRVHIVNTCHIVHISHINYIICTGHIVHCLSYRHQPAELLKQIQKIQQKYLLLHSLCISFEKYHRTTAVRSIISMLERKISESMFIWKAIRQRKI